MNIAGTGITTFAAKIKPDWRSVYVPALIWSKVSNGNWVATDRSAAADYYEAQDVAIYGTESVINNFLNQIEQNRISTQANSNRLTLSAFNATEHIFGADIDYSGSLYATILEIGGRAQNTWKGWSVTTRLRVLGPPFSSAATALLPPFRWVPVGYDGDADRTIIKLDTYNNTMYYEDPQNDIGQWSGYCLFTNQEMMNLRQFCASTRGNFFSLTGISGVLYPFGINRYNIHGDYPYNVVLKALEDEKMWGVSRWLAKLTFCEQV
jgi:hypothetical protein